jgi:hypothetical protein
MAYMRGNPYIYHGKQLEISYGKQNLSIPTEVLDEYVVMRYAQLVDKKLVKKTEDRAVRKHQGNIGCDELCKKLGKKTVMEMVDEEVKKKK